MEENFVEKNRSLWKEASERGALLGGLSVLCLGLKQLCAFASAPLVTAGGPFILWLVEFYGCILILKDAMKRHVAADPDATRRDAYLLGRRMCVFSSFILSTAVLCLVLYVPDNLFTTAIDQMKELYGGSLGASQRAILDEMDLTDSPGILFLSQFLYAWLYGCIVSSMLSLSVPRRPRGRMPVPPQQNEDTNKTDEQ